MVGFTVALVGVISTRPEFSLQRLNQYSKIRDESIVRFVSNDTVAGAGMEPP